jgi:polar amino acid transport system substrate-binding protein
MQSDNSKNLNNNPLVVTISVVSALIAIFVFVTGCQNLPQLLGQTAPSVATPQPIQPLSPTIARSATPKPSETPPVMAPAMPDLKGRALKVGSDTTYPPFESVNDKKEIVGFDVDLVNEICKKINCNATFITTDFDALLIAVSNKTYDFSISGWTITDERGKTVDFGLPYMKNTQVLLVRSDETAVKETADLKKPNVIVAVQLGTTNSITAKKLVADPNKQIKEFQEFPAAIQALLNRQASAVVIDTFDASDLIAENRGQIKVTGKQFGDEYLGMVFPKGDKDLKSAFDGGLKAVYQDGTWSKLCEKWWKDINPRPDCSGAGLPLGK